MHFNGKINFSILDYMNFDVKISDKIGFMPTRIIKKGVQLNGQRIAPYNIWIYETKFDQINFNENLSIFTSYLLQHKNNIIAIASEHDRVELNFYINTQYGQFGFSIPSIELVKISELGIHVNFHILSYGEVEE